MKNFPPYFLITLLCCSLVHCIPNIAFASSENWNWIEVARVNGDTCNLYETETFNISSSVAVWRIVWGYTPRTDVPEDRTYLTINLYGLDNQS